jgi:hypothetical protein
MGVLYIDVVRGDLSAHPQYSIDCSSIEHLSEGNVMPKHVGATLHN